MVMQDDATKKGRSLRGPSIKKHLQRRKITEELIARRREKELARESARSPQPADRPLPNTWKSKRDTSRATPEELSNLHRTIRNLKMLLREYQREQILNLRRIERAQRTLAEVAALPQSDFERASGRRVRHDLGKLSRDVAETARRMGKSAMNLQKGPGAAARAATDRTSATLKLLKAAIEELAAEQTKAGRADPWSWSNAHLARTLNNRVRSTIDTPYRDSLYTDGQLARHVAKLKRKRK